MGHGTKTHGLMTEDELARTLNPLDELRRTVNVESTPKGEEGQQQIDNLMELLSITPVIGHAMSGYDAIKSGGGTLEALEAGDTKGAAIGAGMTGLNTLGAVMGLPFGKAAGKAAEAGKDSVNVFLPVSDPVDVALAKALREEGKTNYEIWRESNMFFGPEGRVREELFDHGGRMRTLLDAPSPNTTYSLEEVISHPELFERMPSLRQHPVRFKEARPDRFLNAARTTEDGTMELPVDAKKSDIAKLLQYTIANNEGLSPAARHGANTLRGDLASAAERAARASHETPQDLEALAAYMERISKEQGGLEAALASKGNKAAGLVANRVAGNADARRVQHRATQAETPQAYPYGTGNFWPNKGISRPVSFGNITPLIRDNLTPEQTRQLLLDWRQFGSGRE